MAKKTVPLPEEVEAQRVRAKPGVEGGRTHPIPKRSPTRPPPSVEGGPTAPVPTPKEEKPAPEFEPESLAREKALKPEEKFEPEALARARRIRTAQERRERVEAARLEALKRKPKVPIEDLPPATREEAIKTAKARADQIKDLAQEFFTNIRITAEPIIKRQLEAALERQRRLGVPAPPELDLPPVSREEAIKTAKARVELITAPLKAANVKVLEEIEAALERSFQQQQKGIAAPPELDLPPKSREAALETARLRLDNLKRLVDVQPAKDYINELDAYNVSIQEYNREVTELSGNVKELEKAGQKLSTTGIDSFNQIVESLNQEGEKLDRLSPDLKNASEVEEYNRRVTALMFKAETLHPFYAAAKKEMDELEKHNEKVRELNSRADALGAPEEPEEPPKTLGTFAYTLLDNVKKEFATAASSEKAIGDRIKDTTFLVAKLIVPGVWAVDWDEMSAGQRAFNAALDVFILVPFVKLGGTVAKTAIRGAERQALRVALKVEKEIIETNAKALADIYGIDASRVYRNLAKAQENYLDELVNVRLMRKAGQVVPEDIATKVKVAREGLEDAAESYNKIIREGKVPFGFDDIRLTQENIKFSERLIEHTDEVARAFTEGTSKANIKQLKAEVSAARARFEEIKTKTTNPEKRAAELARVWEAEAKLNRAQASLKSADIGKTATELASTRDEISLLKAAKPVDALERGKIQARIEQLSARESKLSKEMANFIRAAEIEATKGRMPGGGIITDVKIATRRPVKGIPSGVVARPAREAIERLLSAAIARTVIENIPKPAIREAEITTPDIIREIQKAVDRGVGKAIKEIEVVREAEAVKPVTDPAIKPLTEEEINIRIAEIIDESIKAEIAKLPAVKEVPKVKPEEKIKILPKTITKLVEITKVPLKLKPRIIPRLRIRTDKEKRKRISQSDGSIAWRHGELRGKDVWHVIMHPYQSERDYLSVIGRKPSNTTIVKGPGSAFQTIKLRFGKPPSKKVTGDIGFFDFFIEPKAGRKVSIGFKPDPKQETTGDITIGRRAAQITERTPRLGRGKMRITPKTPRLRR